ncbi:hypothetical protein ACFLQK_00010 [bacterium]
MNFFFKTTDEYYPGFQKLSLFSDVTFRRTVFLFVSFAVISGAFSRFLIGPGREVMNIALSLCYVFPYGIWLSGGMPRRGWAWYACFAVLFLSGTVPAILAGRTVFLLSVPAALFCLYMVHRSAPWIMKSFGYMEKFEMWKEIPLTGISSVLFVILTYNVYATVQGIKVGFMPVENYLVYSVIGLSTYGVSLGILFGILMRRLLDMRFELYQAIMVNACLFFIMLSPTVIGLDNMAVTLAGVLGTSLLSQFVLGLGFYYCRSTRYVLLAYLAFYLFYKSAAYFYMPVTVI